MTQIRTFSQIKYILKLLIQQNNNFVSFIQRTKGFYLGIYTVFLSILINNFILILKNLVKYHQLSTWGLEFYYWIYFFMTERGKILDNLFSSFYFGFFIFFKHLFLFLRKRDTEHKWGRARDRETQNLKQAPASDLSAQSLRWSSDSWTARSWPEPKSDT